VKALSFPYSSLIVDSLGYSRAGNENGDGDGYGYDDDELRGDDLVEGTRGYSMDGSRYISFTLFSHFDQDYNFLMFHYVQD
jgi:hypothetical protein